MVGCAKIEKLDWAMNAYLVSLDKQVQQAFSLTVSGPIVYNNEDTTLQFVIQFPADSGLEYRLPNKGKYFTISTPLEKTDYYIWKPSLLDKTSNNSIDAVFALSVEQQSLIIYQEDAVYPYIVASTDPNCTPSEILEYFCEFIALYSKT